MTTFRDRLAEALHTYIYTSNRDEAVALAVRLIEAGVVADPAEVERLRNIERNFAIYRELKADLPDHIEWETFTRWADETKVERDVARAAVAAGLALRKKWAELKPASSRPKPYKFGFAKALGIAVEDLDAALAGVTDPRAALVQAVWDVLNESVHDFVLVDAVADALWEHGPHIDPPDAIRAGDDTEEGKR